LREIRRKKKNEIVVGNRFLGFVLNSISPQVKVSNADGHANSKISR
jgi:hypothetical protein